MSKTYIDKYYTKRIDAIKYISIVDKMYNLLEYDYIIEPSAGAGAFSDNLPKNTIALDLIPEKDSIIKMDFFDFNFPKGKIIAIGNPPYGRRADLAKKFFNKCALYCDVIAFVLPRSMVRPSMHSNIDTRFHLKYEENLDYFELPDGNNFYRKSVFQIWEKDDFKIREKYKPIKKHKDFNLHHVIYAWDSKDKINNLKNICEIGIGQNSMNIDSFKNFSKGSVWGVEPLQDNVVEIFKEMDFSWVEEEASCAPSISKPNIIETYKKAKIKWENNHMK